MDLTGKWTSESDDGVAVSSGSCWAIAADLVVTNLHVAAGGPRAQVDFPRYGPLAVLGIVAVDRPRDLVIAKVRTGRRKLPVAPRLGNWPRLGTEVYVVGHPEGLPKSITRGIVSAVHLAEDLAPFGVSGRRGDRYVQIDAAISAGCSGGPIFSKAGKVIAVTTFRLQRGQSLNFGIPGEYAEELYRLRSKCRPLHEFANVSNDESRSASEPAPSVVSASSAESSEETSPEQRMVEQIVPFYYAVANADHRVSSEESDMIFRLAGEWGVTPALVREAWKQEQSSGAAGVEAFAKLLWLARMGTMLLSWSPQHRGALIQDLARIASADGTSINEAELVNSFAEGLAVEKPFSIGTKEDELEEDELEEDELEEDELEEDE